jgi:hypothetical protein
MRETQKQKNTHTHTKNPTPTSTPAPFREAQYEHHNQLTVANDIYFFTF